MPDMDAVGVLFGPPLFFSWGSTFFETFGLDLAI